MTTATRKQQTVDPGRSHSPSSRIRYVRHASYDDPRAVRAILETIPGDHGSVLADGACQEAAAPRNASILTAEEERSLFMRMNCLKHLAQKRLDCERRDASQCRRVADRLLGSAREVRNQILLANQGLIVSIAQRFQGPAAGMEDLISEANVALFAATDAFDCHRGFRFSTYATHAVQRQLVRFVQRRLRTLQRETTHEPDFISASACESGSGVDRAKQEILAHEFLARLGPHERELVEQRFALGSVKRPLTLRELGDRHGVSGESIRQQLLRILEKLRGIARKEPNLVEWM